MQQWLAAERGRAVTLARQVGCSKGHLSLIASGQKRPGSLLAQKLIVESQGQLTLEMILGPAMKEDRAAFHDAPSDTQPARARPQSEGQNGAVHHFSEAPASSSSALSREAGSAPAARKAQTS